MGFRIYSNVVKKGFKRCENNTKQLQLCSKLKVIGLPKIHHVAKDYVLMRNSYIQLRLLANTKL